MEELTQQKPAPFIDRRNSTAALLPAGRERRQFSDSREAAPPEVAELAQAVDQYKLEHRRRFITFEELHGVISQLGYRKG